MKYTIFKELRPVLWTEKLDESIGVYCGILGFRCMEKNEAWGWASLQRDGVGIMLAKPNAHIGFTEPRFTGSLYITVANVDALWNNVKDKLELVYAPEDFPWEMREFAVYDNNGYILQFGQPLT